MGFETVVRPVVFPNIRPPAARTVPIEDAPDKGLAVITGGGGGIVEWSYSGQSSWSTARMVEVRRTFSKVRLYSALPDGTFDKETYLEFEVLESITYLENGKVSHTAVFAAAQSAANWEVMGRNYVRSGGTG